jgi:hypothetical protein
MNDDLDARVRRVFQAITDHSPDLGPAPATGALRSRPRRGPTELAVAAAAIAVVGVGGLSWLAVGRDDPASSEPPTAAAMTSTSVLSPLAPTVSTAMATTVDSVAIDGDRPFPAYVVAGTGDPTAGATVEAEPPGVDQSPQPPGGPTAYPVIEAEAVGAVSVAAHLRHQPYVAPQVNAVIGRGEPGLAIEDLYTFVVGDGASAIVEARGYTDVGDWQTSLTNPLANINLTEGTTVEPVSVGDVRGRLVVSGAAASAVVWSPDGVTWALVTGPRDDDELLALAESVTFETEVGAWMTRYGVDLPPVFVQ